MRPEKQNRRGHRARAGNLEHSSADECSEHNTNNGRGQTKVFTSWKLDVMDALSVDVEVTDLDFRVGFRIMQHVNSSSRIAWPSVARLAAQLGKSEDRVRASTKRLAAAGWLVKERRSQKKPNEYSFLTDRMNAVIDGMLLRVENIGSERNDHAELHGQNRDDHAEMRGGDHAELHGPDHADLHGKHLNQNYLKGTPSDSMALEGQASQGETDAVFAKPESVGAAIRAIARLNVPAPFVDQAIRMLMAGCLHPSHITDWQSEAEAGHAAA